MTKHMIPHPKVVSKEETYYAYLSLVNQDEKKLITPFRCRIIISDDKNVLDYKINNKNKLRKFYGKSIYLF